MKIPNTKRKKALFIIDLHPPFLLERNRYITKNIKKIVENIDYDCIIVSQAYNKKKSLWEKQIGWLEWEKPWDIPDDIRKSLASKNVFYGKKIAKSIFKCDNINVVEILKKYKIEEIHLCWLESNDCVFASAFESFDFAYYTFVIEEASETWHTKENHDSAIKLLRYACFTNNSNFVGKDKIDFFEL